MINSELKKQTDIISDVIKMTSNRNILLLHQETAPIRELMLSFVLENLRNTDTSLIWVCWNEPATAVKKRIRNSGYDQNNIYFIDSVGNIIEDEKTILRTHNNYSGILMDIQKLIRNKKFVLVLDSPDIVQSQDNKKRSIDFLSTLSRMCTNSGGTLYSPVSVDLLDFQTQKIFKSIFNVVFHVEERVIKIENEHYKGDIYYDTENNNIVFKQFPTLDIDQIEDFFNFSSEEKNDLDEMVKKQLDLNKDIV